MSRAREHAASDVRSPYEGRAAAAGVTPLWTFFHDWFASEPRSAAAAHRWHYDGLRPLLLDAANAISTADADWHAQTKRVSPSGKVPRARGTPATSHRPGSTAGAR